jgi:hypothetical protein
VSAAGDEGLANRVTALESRVQQLEDHPAVRRLINSWGPAVDTGSSQEAANLWDDDGVLDSDLSRLEGPVAVIAMVESKGQQALIGQGCAHVQSAPVITVDGDRATATASSQVFLHTEDGYDVWRGSANQWECRRTSDGCRLTRRLNREVDGTSGSGAVLVHTFDSPS